MLFRSDRKSTRLNSSHLVISYAVFCLKKKKSTSLQLNQMGVREILAPRASEWGPARQDNPDASTVASAPLAVSSLGFFFFFFNDTATTEIYTLSLHDALPIYVARANRELVELHAHAARSGG